MKHLCLVEGCGGRQIVGRTACVSPVCLKKTLFAMLMVFKFKLNKIPRDIRGLLVSVINKEAAAQLMMK
jgi:hypothetical protein